MHIKSRMLLPADPDAAADGDASDPRAELTQQLLEHQRYKQAAETLSALEARRGLVWIRESVPAEFAGEELLAVDTFDLLRAFQVLLERLGEEARLELQRDTVSVAEKIDWLTAQLAARRSLELLALLAEQPSRLDRIATFLAVLEMIRLRTIVAFQRRLLGEIRLALRDAPAAGDAS
jgi:segregation and condensation protein A